MFFIGIDIVVENSWLRAEEAKQREETNRWCQNQGCTQLVSNIKQENRFGLEIEANFALFTELIFSDETDIMTMIIKSQLIEQIHGRT